MNGSQLVTCGVREWMYAAHAANEPGARAAGTVGNPTLQVGGLQEAVMEPPPGNAVAAVQDCVHPEPAFTTVGSDAVHVRGILLRVVPLELLGREVFPITSVTV